MYIQCRIMILLFNAKTWRRSLHVYCIESLISWSTRAYEEYTLVKNNKILLYTFLLVCIKMNLYNPLMLNLAHIDILYFIYIYSDVEIYYSRIIPRFISAL